MTSQAADRRIDAQGHTLAASVFEALWSVLASARMGTNRHRPLAWGFLAVTLAGLAAGLFLTGAAGLELAGLAPAGVELAMCLIAIPLTAPLIGYRSGGLLAAVATPPVAECRMLLGRWARRGK